MGCKEIAVCTHCRERFCESCSNVTCATCQDLAACEECLEECVECGEQTCPSCMSEDGNCGSCQEKIDKFEEQESCNHEGSVVDGECEDCGKGGLESDSEIYEKENPR